MRWKDDRPDQLKDTKLYGDNNTLASIKSTVQFASTPNVARDLILKLSNGARI